MAQAIAPHLAALRRMVNAAVRALQVADISRLASPGALLWSGNTTPGLVAVATI
ncbi:hypothetical protein AGR1B_Cc120506 [Agrobacterium fabacearum S56]|uniref:hypothetical protein n=1 Tax=Agrobacterium tumefaciens TaxID=358 RepID=UPI0009D1CFD1|nr:hypothetical protein [Agrobacterium tumefaciens]CUW90150.1 hypothetical protein AGR1B_Cc120506 [Agrobacterium fabacearum S56]